MAIEKFTIQQKKEYAKTLFTSYPDLTQKEIAQRVSINEKTMGKWVAEGLWLSLRKSLLTTKKDTLSRLYEILSSAITAIEETSYGDTKLADMVIKYTAAIKNIETETNTGQMIETGMSFIRFVMKDDTDAAKKITEFFDAFIQERLKNI